VSAEAPSRYDCNGSQLGLAFCIAWSSQWLERAVATIITVPPAGFSWRTKSSAEFSVAQGIYVDTESGWFSDRTVRYLASGKPALVQDTLRSHLSGG
jgi:hypothetical protein